MKFFLPFALLASVYSSLAHAGLVTIDYVAKVTQRSGESTYPGLNHNVGDMVSGQLIIDLTKAERESVDFGHRSNFTSHNSFELVTGYFNQPSGASLDRVTIYNGIYPDLVAGGEDHLRVSDGFVNSSKYVSQYTSFNLWLSLGKLDWIKTDKIDDINLTINNAESMADSNLIVHRWDSIVHWDPNCPCSANHISEYLKLESLHISSAKVPEPSSLWLLALGFIGLASTRILMRRPLSYFFHAIFAPPCPAHRPHRASI